MIALLGNRSPDQPAHQSFYSPTGIGIDPDRLGERAAIASESQLSVVMLYFYGTAQVHESGPVKDAIFSKLLVREQEHVGADTGVGVLIKLTRAEDLRGNPLD